MADEEFSVKRLLSGAIGPRIILAFEVPKGHFEFARVQCAPSPIEQGGADDGATGVVGHGFGCVW